ncbi:S8 family serine peptidase [Adhaeribacter soli]|uniref:S8 family serine peptidase n=1 Tax=Adhaeribacter soli TaxID=2607655 RepID=A0A5N1IQ76_9BACT|nr:S8 family serine peptidase [Adhaeribacter soli]KAA9326001.1 S8 family serine peptidase [Adhaeribacter soli]
MNFSSDHFLYRWLPALFFIVSATIFPAHAQEKFWVVLKDKKGVAFDPYQYFDAKAIERRQLQGLPLSDETDKPLNPAYVLKIAQLTDSVSGSSRWLNAVACFATPEQVKALRQQVFVKEILPFRQQAAVLANFPVDKEKSLSRKELKILRNQTASLGAADFSARGLDGKGVRVAVLDAGFRGVDSEAGFEHLRRNKQILKTWDFVKRREYAYDYSTHGTMVLSCIGGRMGENNVGLATGAEFLLARTERMHSERYSEEEHWLAAMEWADQNGADIINSSLGYTYNRYFPEQMDGRTSFVARAANLAARKGILVVNANGNDGSNKTWKILGTPADADSVLAVGGIDPEDLMHVDFSSFGPTATKKMKPNVSAFGVVIAVGPNGSEQTQGTSFASPLVAGFAACAWQSNRQLSNMQLFRQIEQSGHLYPYFDYAHGFGVPQARRFLGETVQEAEPTIAFERTGNQLTILIKPRFLPQVSPDSIQKAFTGNAPYALPVDFPTPDYVYYHLVNPKGYLDKYFVVKPGKEAEVATLNLAYLKPGSQVRVYYRGYTGTFTY